MTDPKNTENNGRFQDGNPGKPKGAVNKFTKLKESFFNIADKVKWEDEIVKLIQPEEGKINKRELKWFTEQLIKLIPKDVNLGPQGENPLQIIISDKYLPQKKGNGGNGKDTDPDT